METGVRAIPVIFSIQPSGMRWEKITGQEPVSRIEPQILKARSLVPEKIPMSLSNLSVNEEDERFPG